MKWVHNKATGLRAPVSAVAIRPDENTLIPAGGFGGLTIEAPKRSGSVSGELGIIYEAAPAPDKQPAALRILRQAFSVLGDGVSPLTEASNAGLTILSSIGSPSAPSKFRLDSGAPFGVCLAAKITPITILKSEIQVVDLFDTTNSRPLAASRIEISRKTLPDRIALNSVTCIELTALDLPASAMRISGALVIPYRTPRQPPKSARSSGTSNCIGRGTPSRPVSMARLLCPLSVIGRFKASS